MKHVRALFIHHSTGGLLLRFGNVRNILHMLAPEIELWDHAYNRYSSDVLSRLLGPLTFRTGLSDSKGRPTGKDFNITISNNSPKEYADIFTRDTHDDTLRSILEFDVILFKNCFPTTRIESDNKLDLYKKYYSTIINRLILLPNQFIIITPPPLRMEMTRSDWANRARNLSDWLSKQEKLNIRVFDFFNLLADSLGTNKNMLRREYCPIIPFDSHPNMYANRRIGKEFVMFLLTALAKNTS